MDKVIQVIADMLTDIQNNTGYGQILIDIKDKSITATSTITDKVNIKIE